MYRLLQDVKILDLTRLLPGGFATQLLGDLGAEVLKVEDPWQGDYIRWMEPLLPGSRESGFHWALNRNKKSVTLNLKSEEGRDIFFKLLKEYDVVLEGFRPGVMDSLGLGYEKLAQINPRVILCSISGYGQDGPYRLRSGHDINYNAVAGALGLTGPAGGEPVIPALQVADVGGGGLMAVAGVLAACFSREKTGRGQYIDISMMDGVVSWLVMLFAQLSCGASNLLRGKTLLSGGAICYNVYPTADGEFMSLGALEPKFWQEFCLAVDREDLISKGLSSDPADFAQMRELFKSRTRAEWVEFFKDRDACCEPVLNLAEVQEHPQVAARQMLINLEHPQAGPVKVPANPIKLPREETVADGLPPGFGQDTLEILQELGYSREELKRLKEAGVI